MIRAEERAAQIHRERAVRMPFAIEVVDFDRIGERVLIRRAEPTQIRRERQRSLVVNLCDEIAMTPGLKLKVEMPAAADKVVILGNGSEFATGTNVSTFEFEPTGAAVYRVEAYRRGHPWIYSNPIYVR